MECVTEPGSSLIVFPSLRAVHIFTLERPNPIVAGQTLLHQLACNIATPAIPGSCRFLLKVEIRHQSHFFQTSVCQRAVFAKDRVPSADIYDHCLRRRRHLPYCHFFAAPLYLLLILHCPHVKGGRHGAIIKPSAEQTLGATHVRPGRKCKKQKV